jgi:formamidopyrimidine-DNA glycosylase
MPELPEVETTRRGLAPWVEGQAITTVRVRERRLRWPLDRSFEPSLVGRTIRAASRRAKYLLLELDEATLIVHLGMSGSLRIVDEALAPKKHDHVDVVLASGRCIRFNDPRRFGSMHVVRGPLEQHALLRHLGPEPLSNEFSATHLHRITRRRSIAIKPLLMNATIVVGVGNIYASEALFHAKVHPSRAARRLSLGDCERIVWAVKRVLGAAIEVGGTTLRDYVNAEGAPGYFRQKLYVYERAEAPCRVCGTPIRQRKQGQRSTYWCPACQPSKTRV